MKKQTGIWIDSSKAVIMTFAEGRELIIELKSDIENKIYHHHQGNQGDFMGTRHINNEKKFDERKRQQTDYFLKTVIKEIKGADEFYENKAQKKIEDDEASLRHRLKSVETADAMTTNQMVAKTKKYYNL